MKQTTIVGFAWGIADAENCRSHCGINYPEATHFTWFDHNSNHQIAGKTNHKCNCKKDVDTEKKVNEVGAVSGIVDCDITGKRMQIADAIENYSYTTDKKSFHG